MEILTLAIKRSPGEGQPILPAIEPARREGAQLMHAQAMAIALAPNQALLIGGLQFSVGGANLAVAIDIDERAIERVAAAVRRALHCA